MLLIGPWMGIAASASLSAASSEDTNPTGQMIYERRCAVCHDHPQDRIPPKAYLVTRTHAYIVGALTTGPMQGQATGLSAAEIDAVAGYLSEEAKAAMSSEEKPHELKDPELLANLCKRPAPPFIMHPGDWNGFSPDLKNTRFQAKPGISPSDVPRLKPKWVFAYPGTTVFGPPSQVAGRVFLGTVSGYVLSLDASTGCTYWATKAGAAVHSPVSIGRWTIQRGPGGSRTHLAAYFGDAKAIVHAVDAETGESLWATHVDEHPFATISGSPALYKDRLYVPLTSGEGSMGPRGDYPCCTFRGSIVALDAHTGKILWKTYTSPEAPKPFKLNAAGTWNFGPAGVGIWSAVTVDVKRARVYGTTAESKTALSVDTSDAIMAFDWGTGARQWVTQATAHDNWIQGCDGEVPGANCPDPLGPDADFDTPVMLARPGHGHLAIAAQKSGLVTAVDPDAGGRIVWQRNLAREAPLPAGVILRDRAQLGVVYGMAADDAHIYAAIADPSVEKAHIPLGLYALNIADGKIAWHTPGASCTWGEQGCTGAQHTAVTAMPGVVFAGSANGHIIAYAAHDGRVIWDFDTARSYAAVNGVIAQGGSIEGISSVLADGTLYVASGYATFGGGVGDSLIAFTVDGR